MGKLFILSVEEDDLETAEKIMAFIESTELVMCTDLPSAPLRYKALCIDAACRQVFWQGKFIELTPMEFDVFHLLARRPGRVFSKGRSMSSPPLIRLTAVGRESPASFTSCVIN